MNFFFLAEMSLANCASDAAVDSRAGPSSQGTLLSGATSTAVGTGRHHRHHRRVDDFDMASVCSTCSSSSSDDDEDYSYQLPARRAYGGVRISYVPNDALALASARQRSRTMTPSSASRLDKEKEKNCIIS